jgi:hypothetical protein
MMLTASKLEKKAIASKELFKKIQNNCAQAIGLGAII